MKDKTKIEVMQILNEGRKNMYSHLEDDEQCILEERNVLLQLSDHGFENLTDDKILDYLYEDYTSEDIFIESIWKE